VRTKLFIYVILLWALISIACTSTILVPQMTFTPLPTYTPYSTYTPIPTYTPRPTVTPTMIPGVLECYMIEDKHASGMTHAQWDAYKESIKYKQIYFKGKVEEISDLTDCVFLSDIKSKCVMCLKGIPSNIFNRIHEGQILEGYGIISYSASAITNVQIGIADLNFLNLP
jgi:hypothetical protein